MKNGHQITMLGTGFIGSFYTETIHGIRGRDRIQTVCGLPRESAEKFAREWDIPKATDNMKEAINDPETNLVVIALPNYLHKEALEYLIENNYFLETEVEFIEFIEKLTIDFFFLSET